MTTIKTSSLRTYNRVHNYLYNKHIECWGDLEKLEISFFGLDKNQTDQLLEKLIKHFHFNINDLTSSLLCPFIGCDASFIAIYQPINTVLQWRKRTKQPSVQQAKNLPC